MRSTAKIGSDNKVAIVIPPTSFAVSYNTIPLQMIGKEPPDTAAHTNHNNNVHYVKTEAWLCKRHGTEPQIQAAKPASPAKITPARRPRRALMSQTLGEVGNKESKGNTLKTMR